jgi:hypothetical protein
MRWIGLLVADKKYTHPFSDLKTKGKPSREIVLLAQCAFTINSYEKLA